MQASHIRLLATAALAALLCIAGASAVAANPSPLRSNVPVEGQAPGFAGATTWLNSAPLTPQQLRGKVVLVDFWTYSCINCIRTVPYLRAWSAKYRDQGLLVVGVHTPEFRFEENLVNISAAVGRFHLDYPIAVDSKQQIWRAWGNQYWPAMYLADANGKIRYHQFGEGDYVRTERAIQSLLAEAHGAPVDSTLVNPAASGEQMAPDLASLRSGETYVGYAKAANVSPGTQLLRDRSQTYAAGRLGMKQWGLSGQWTVGAEGAMVDAPGAGLVYRFSARDLHLVAGPGKMARTIRIKVTIDGHPPGLDHGADTDADGNGVIDATRLYQLVRLRGAVKEHRFEVRFEGKGAEAFAFTFG